jgi:hypothetical protein
LTQVRDTPWDIDGQTIVGTDYMPGSKSLEKKPPERPTHANVVVSPGSLREAVGAMMTTTKGAVADFEAFKARVREKVRHLHENTHKNPGGKAGQEAANGLGAGAVYTDTYDDDPAGTQELIDNQERLLRAVADIVEQVGYYTGLLNNAAQYYASADKASFPAAPSGSDS